MSVPMLGQGGVAKLWIAICPVKWLTSPMVKRAFITLSHGATRVRFGMVLCGCLCAAAVSLGAEYVQAPASISSGGGSATGGNYRIRSELGSSVAGVAVGDGLDLKSGYVAQLYEPAALQLATGSINLAEEATTQLVAVAVMDDETLTPLTGDGPTWGIVSGPVRHVSNGWISADAVYENTAAQAQASWQSMTGRVDLLILDINPDNFGSYAGDGLPDDWQVGYFGLNNPDAAPDADPFNSRQDNYFKYIAGLDPTDSNSLFQFQIATGTNGPEITLYPRFGNRGYTVQYLTNLEISNWQDLTDASIEDDGLTRTLVDTNTLRMRSYRVWITKP